MAIPAPEHGRLSEPWAVLCVLVIALLVKFIHMQGMVVDSPFRADALQYVKTAVNIAQYGVFGEAWGPDGLVVSRLPGYPIALSVLVGITEAADELYRLARLLNVVLGSVSAVLLYSIARRRFSRAISFAMALLLIVNPHVLSLEGYVLSETIFLFELLLLVWLLAGATEHGRGMSWAAVGFVAGFALLTRPSFAVFLPFLFVVFLIARCGRIHAGKLATWGLVGYLLAVLPWFAYTAFHDVPFTGTKNNTVTLVAGFYPDLVYKDPRYYGYPYSDPQAPDIHDDSAKAIRQLGSWIVEEPAKYLLWFFYGKPKVLWQWETVQGAGDVAIYPLRRSVFEDQGVFMALRAVYKLLHPLLVVLMFVGIVRCLLEGGDVLALSIGAVVIYFIIIHIVFFSLPRYSIPLRPFMLYFDMCALSYIHGLWNRYRSLTAAVS